MTMKQYISLLLLSPLTSARELGDTPDNVLSRLEIHVSGFYDIYARNVVRL